MDMAEVSQSFVGLYNLMLRDQFIHICSQDLAYFSKYAFRVNLRKMADLADHFKDARNVNAVHAVDKSRSY